MEMDNGEQFLFQLTRVVHPRDVLRAMTTFQLLRLGRTLREGNQIKSLRRYESRSHFRIADAPPLLTSPTSGHSSSTGTVFEAG